MNRADQRKIATALFRLSISQPPKPEEPVSRSLALREFKLDSLAIATVLDRLDCDLSEIETAIAINAAWAAYWAVHGHRNLRQRFAAIAARQKRTLCRVHHGWGNA